MRELPAGRVLRDTFTTISADGSLVTLADVPVGDYRVDVE